MNQPIYFMKSIPMFISLVLVSLISIAQDTLTEKQSKILAIINDYNIHGDDYIGYNPLPSFTMKDALETKLKTNKEKAEYTRNILAKELQKIKDIELINIQNQELLENNRSQVLIYAQKDEISNGSFTDYEKFIAVYNYYTYIYSLNSIQEELKLLKATKAEIDKIKKEDPQNYQSGKRFKEITGVLKELKKTDRHSISVLGWKHHLQ